MSVFCTSYFCEFKNIRKCFVLAHRDSMLKLVSNCPGSRVTFKMRQYVNSIEVISVTSEYPQGDDWVCFAVVTTLTQLQNCVAHNILCVIGCVMSEAWYTEQEYPQDGKRLTASIECIFIRYKFWIVICSLKVKKWNYCNL